MKTILGFTFMILAWGLWGAMTGFYGIETSITSIFWQVSMVVTTMIGTILINNK